MQDHSVLFLLVMQDGKTIISGWSDGKIRGFGPQSGKLLYTISDAHHKAVTAIAVTSDSNRIISGGKEGGLLGAAECFCVLLGSRCEDRSVHA
jgi:WD40 repeat protein